MKSSVGRIMLLFCLVILTNTTWAQQDTIPIVFIDMEDTLKNENYKIEINGSIFSNNNNILTYSKLQGFNQFGDSIGMNVFFKEDTLTFTNISLTGLTFIPQDHVWFFTILDPRKSPECNNLNARICASFYSKWGNAEYYFTK